MVNVNVNTEEIATSEAVESHEQDNDGAQNQQQSSGTIDYSPRDLFGTKIKAGDEITYATRAGQRTNLNVGRVINIVKEQKWPDSSVPEMKLKVRRSLSTRDDNREVEVHGADSPTVILSQYNRAIVLQRSSGRPPRRPDVTA